MTDCQLDTGRCVLFYSHARDNHEKPATDGKAVLLSFENSDKLADFLTNFGSQLEGEHIDLPFEIVGLGCILAPQL